MRGVVDEGPFVLSASGACRSGPAPPRCATSAATRGAEPEPAPFLYHVNFGAPLWAPGARAARGSAGVAPRDADAAAHEGTWDERAAETSRRPRARVRARAPAPARRSSHRDGLSSCASAGRSARSRACASGSTPALGALGIEPANCSVLGRAHDRAEGRLPVLAPGEERETWLEIQAVRG